MPIYQPNLIYTCVRGLRSTTQTRKVLIMKYAINLLIALLMILSAHLARDYTENGLLRFVAYLCIVIVGVSLMGVIGKHLKSKPPSSN